MPFQRLSSGALRLVNGKALLLSSTSAPPVVAVTAISLTPATGTANSAAGTVIGTLAATVSNGSLTNPVWTLTGTAGGDFQIVNGNQVAVLPSNVPAGNYTITAQVAASNLATPFSQAVAVTMGAGGTTPDWDALTPYSQVALGWMNATSAALATPFVTTNHRMQRGDVPSGSRLGLFKADGTAIPTQQDNEALPHSDGSLASATLSAILPDTIAGNGSASYFVKPVSGAKNSTPKFTLSAWAAQNDLRLIIRTNLANLNDDTANFEMRVNDAISAGLYEGSSSGSDYPLTSIRVDRSGPVCMGWKFKGFARRRSDGAWHRSLVGEMYVTAVSLTDMLVDGIFKQPIGVNTGVNSAQTVGPANNSSIPPIHGICELWNGAPGSGTLLHTWGGPNDFRATTVTADVTNNFIVFPTSGVGRSRNTLGYVLKSTGALPGGVQASTIYFTQQDYYSQNCVMFHSKAFTITDGPNLYQSNNNYPIWGNYGAYGTVVTSSFSGDWRKVQCYACVQAGTSANSPPSGTADNQVDGTVKWSPVNVVLTSPGSGVLTAWPVVSIFPSCGAPLVDETTSDPIWTGAGAAPRVEVIKDLTYLCRWARAFPPYDLTLATLYPDGLTFDGFSVSEPYVQQQIDNFGDNPGTTLLGYLNVSASNALLQQTSVMVQRHMRAEALGWADHWSYVDDARSFQPVVGNAGPGNAAGRYTGLGPSIPDFWYDYRGVRGPGQWDGLGSTLDGNWYNAKYSTILDGSHLPAWWILPYEKTARTIFLDQGIALANGVFLSGYKSGNTLGGRTYSNTLLINQQQRGSGWSTRAIDTLDDVLPASHALRPYLTDVIQDGIDFALAVIADNQANNQAAYNLGTLRWGGGTVQNWFIAHMLMPIAQAARKARNPGWRTFAEHVASRWYLRWFDDDTGGNAGLIDNNNFSATPNFSVDADVAAGDVLTLAPDGGGANGIPAALTYTVQAGQTRAQIASALAALVNSTPAWTSFGWVAVADEGNEWFRIRMPSALFNANNHNALQTINSPNPTISHVGKLSGIHNFAWFQRPSGTTFTSFAQMLEFNLGPSWPQTTQTTISLLGSQSDLLGPDGHVPWDTTDYPLIHWACVATMVEAGITDARKIYDRMTARIQATGGGPKMSVYIQNSPSLGLSNVNRTFNNFNLTAYHLQATRTQH